MSTREELRAAAAREVDRWERQLTDELLRLFDRQEAVVLARLQGTKARKHTRHWDPPSTRPLEVKAVIDPARWMGEAMKAVAPIVGRLFAAVYKRVAQMLVPGAPAAPEDSSAMDTAIEERLELVAQGVQTATEEVERFIASEEDAGTAMPEIVAGVRDLYAARKPAWAARIATVSAVGSINQAALFAAADQGASAKQWISQRDDVVRDTHRAADGQVRLLDERFKLGGIPTHPRRSLLMFPGDPSPSVPLDEIMNCRCTLVFSPPRAGRKDAGPLEQKDRVRTAAGAAHYGLPIGAVITADPDDQPSLPLAPAFSGGRSSSGSGSSSSRRPPRAIAGNALVEATDDDDVLDLIERLSPPGEVPDPDETRVLAIKDQKGRVGGFVVWQSVDGSHPKGTVLAVSVHPALKGQRVGDQLVAAAMTVDPSVKPQSRPQSGSTRPPAPAAARVPVEKPRRPQLPIGPDGLPVIPSAAGPDDEPGPSGDFAADVERIERLQKAYMAGGYDTPRLFSRGGRYTPERAAQHRELYDHFLNKPGVKAEKKALIMAGLPGSGKTTTLNSPAGQAALGVDLDEYVIVNGDDVKEEMIRRGMVPDYPGLSPEESATMIQAEAFEVASSIMRKAGRSGLNFAYDTTLRTLGNLGHATGAGGRDYEYTLMLVDVPLSVAKQRARDRYLAGDRYVPAGFIDMQKSSNDRYLSAPAQNFDRQKGDVDRWLLVDNAGLQPVVVAQGEKRPVALGGDPDEDDFYDPDL